MNVTLYHHHLGPSKDVVLLVDVIALPAKNGRKRIWTWGHFIESSTLGWPTEKSHTQRWPNTLQVKRNIQNNHQCNLDIPWKSMVGRSKFPVETFDSFFWGHVNSLNLPLSPSAPSGWTPQNNIHFCKVHVSHHGPLLLNAKKTPTHKFKTKLGSILNFSPFTKVFLNVVTPENSTALVDRGLKIFPANHFWCDSGWFTQPTLSTCTAVTCTWWNGPCVEPRFWRPKDLAFYVTKKTSL